MFTPAVVQHIPLGAEPAVQILDQTADVLTAPGVLPLIIVQLVPVPVEQLVDRAAPALDRRTRHKPSLPPRHITHPQSSPPHTRMQEEPPTRTRPVFARVPESPIHIPGPGSPR